ncbi:MAG: dGTP triphosphohydrolase [Succinivibrio sp.]
MKIEDISDRLFCAKRMRGEHLEERQCLSFLADPALYSFGCEQDRLKVSVCAPVRRLQQKTQVFPLDVKAASRNRLTHSMEVQEYTRLISFGIFSKIKSPLLTEITKPFLSCLHTAALLHDVGNPPFGHFGESLIRSWVKSMVENRHISSEISLPEKEDLLTFNGNAQGLRLIHSIQDLNLTLGQYAAMIKVPYTIKELLMGKGKGSSANGIHSDYYSWSYSNAGVFLSEKPLLEAIREELRRDTRHPFATIIEYSDDLAYVLADLEDAYDRGLINRYTIQHLCSKINDYPELEEMAEYLDEKKIEEMFRHGKSVALFYLRDVISYFVIRDLSQSIADNFEYWLETGEADFSNGEYPGITVLKMLKDFEFKTVYNHFEVQTLDLSGASYIEGLFSRYQKILFEKTDNFCQELTATGGDSYCMRIASRISRRHKEYFLKSLKEGTLSEMYLRIRMIVDYISGMTDTFAESEFKVFNGIR